ncbi:MAG: arginine--tRNA ligase [Candidatus Omnitrophica bacterium]|nr:arginine--tRNA ligase [Candidatus Omnitrophota bacterium]
MAVLFHDELVELIRGAIAPLFQDIPLPAIELEEPAEKANGDIACNIALRSAKVLRKPPLVIAAEFLALIQKGLAVSRLNCRVVRLEVKGPGFINFFLTPYAVGSVLDEVFAQGSDFGRSQAGKGIKVMMEFVSANPTGPLSVAHARQAVVGDVLGNILRFLGYDLTKEYYMNDGGNQITTLGRSVELRARKILGESVDFPEDCYQGEYIKDMAQIFLDQNQIQKLADLQALADRPQRIKKFSADYLIQVNQTELKDFRAYFDVWSYESQIATRDKIEVVLAEFQNRGLAYEHEGALWFKSTLFGDDKDRVVRKSDGQFTYLSPDIVYHKNKFERGFDRLINIWGPDHHGYIPRIKAAAQALGKNADAVQVLIVQLATVIRAGKIVSMSTRRGEYISLREVMEEVGVDAARFFFLMRHIQMHLEFDLDLAKKETAENPVFYIQYAHARINSINNKAAETRITPRTGKFQHLTAPEELALIKKISDFTEALTICREQNDPYTLAEYLHQLAGSFHKFYDMHRVLVEDADLSAERLGLVNAVKIILANGLRLMGVTVPDKM